MNWIRRQILNAAPLTTIIICVLTHKWWAPYLESTRFQGSMQLIAPSASVHLALGNPSGATTSVSNPDNYLMIKPQYALSYNRSKGTANWVSWELNSSWLGKMDRQNDFRPDETLPSGWEQVTTRFARSQKSKVKSQKNKNILLAPRIHLWIGNKCKNTDMWCKKYYFPNQAPLFMNFLLLTFDF